MRYAASCTHPLQFSLVPVGAVIILLVVSIIAKITPKGRKMISIFEVFIQIFKYQQVNL
jgi:hypothetical protein